jgi:uncharacterized membrane protein
MAKVERTVTINAPVEKVFSYIADPTKELEFIQGMTDIRKVKGLGEGMTYEWTYKMLGISQKGSSEVTEYKSNERYVSKSSGGIVSTWTYTFTSEAGGTKMFLCVEFSVPMPILGKFAEHVVLKQTERETDLAMATLKDRIEG